MLLSYQPNFYPESEQDIYDYMKAMCDATSLGIISSTGNSTPPAR